jgi:tyrosinase
MAGVAASPGDPIFFLHHTFVDRTYAKWQGTDPARVNNINGCATPGENCQPLTPDTVLTSRGLKPDVTVRDMLNIQEEFLCYSYDY